MAPPEDGDESIRANKQRLPDDVSKVRAFVISLRVSVIIILAILAGVLGYFSFQITRDAEIALFETAYESEVRILSEVVDRGFLAKKKAAQATATAFSFPAGGKATHSDFADFARYQLPLGNGRALSVSPVVYTEDREAYQDFVKENWRNVVGSGLPSLSNSTQSALKTTLLRGIYGKFNGSNVPADWGTTRQFWVPVMEIAPLSDNWAAIMFNLYNESNRRAAIDTVMATADASSTDIIFLVQDGNKKTRASSIMLAPIFGMRSPSPLDSSTPEERVITGLASLVYSWDQVLNESLPSTVADMDIVIFGPRQVYTLRISRGSIVNVGEGDLHEASGAASDRYLRVLRAQAGLIFILKVYPTPAFMKSFYTRAPETQAAVVVALVVGVTAVFLAYDWASRRRISSLSKEAYVASTLIGEVFPTTVIDRLVASVNTGRSISRRSRFSGALEWATTADDTKDDHHRYGGKSSPSSLSHPAPTSPPGNLFTRLFESKPGPDLVPAAARRPSQMQNRWSLGRRSSSGGHIMAAPGGGWVSGPNAVLSGAQSGPAGHGQSAPIADRFESVTVLFSDFVSFTSWSASVKPETVITVLEVYFRLFDIKARSLGIFKVETIGDSYMAACGLPTVRADHAVRMAEFAIEMLASAKRAGEETGVKLEMRIGLHSGSVVAGVIRADKSRFQLFGDTVNTASRMESTSEPGRIQVSAEAHALLQEAGCHVLEYRGKTAAKGKGEVDTYWLIGGNPNKPFRRRSSVAAGQANPTGAHIPASGSNENLDSPGGGNEGGQEGGSTHVGPSPGQSPSEHEQLSGETPPAAQTDVRLIM